MRNYRSIYQIYISKVVMCLFSGKIVLKSIKIELGLLYLVINNNLRGNFGELLSVIMYVYTTHWLPQVYGEIIDEWMSMTVYFSKLHSHELNFFIFSNMDVHAFLGYRIAQVNDIQSSRLYISSYYIVVVLCLDFNQLQVSIQYIKC